MNSYAARLASFTSWPHVCPSASTVARAGFRREYDPTFPSPDLTRKKHRNQKTRQQYTRRSLQITQPATQSITQPATQPAHQSTQLATQPEHSVKQEEELQQANAENTAEKASGSKAISTKNTAHFSMIPRQVATQQAENDTAIWPIIPTVSVWYITAMSTQEKDLLRRSQPIGPLQARITYRTMHIWTN
ncbi:hypothetical protein HO133_003366 [Letharia lupina]|uniref:Uncharacterized protein n=1 Tax=Letharia lupina TaxID=560253 RepID=A0A8H6FA33_9LECA|nr:uncharacterized protein HO133_003366 [Letharia lupina]KAF6220234.1 hypothetical protein HO133_003366 [Letharia lupina]